MEWHPAGWSVCLPLLIFPCTIKSEVLFWHRLTRVVPEKGPQNGYGGGGGSELWKILFLALSVWFFLCV